MANHKANEPRVFMRIPKSFHDKIMVMAKEQQIEATVMMEQCEILYYPSRV